MTMKTRFYRFSLLCASAVIFLITCTSPSGRDIVATADNSWIEELTIPQLQEGYREGKYTVAQIVTIYLDRIHNLDQNGQSLIR